MGHPLNPKTRGFTLLEALIALSISAFLLTGLYRVVNGTARQVQSLENRAEALHLWIYLRRLLNHDLDYLLSEMPNNILRDGNDALTLRCSGGLLPDWRMGPQVEVIYQWREQTTQDGIIWERLIKPLGADKEEAIVTLRLDKGLKKMDYALLDTQDWQLFGESAQPPPWKAIRWRFEWVEIGEWSLVRNLLPPTHLTPKFQ